MKRKARQKRGAFTAFSFSNKPISEVQPDITVGRPKISPSFEVTNLVSTSVSSPQTFSFSYAEETSPKSFSVDIPQLYDNTLRTTSSHELRSFPHIDDQSSESRDHEEITNVASNSDHDFLFDDEVAPELAMHGSFVTSISLSPAEQKHFIEKSDICLPHNQRRINRRELKALLKQAKKNRSTLDDTSLAAIDDLASRLQSECFFGFSSTFSNPIRVAPPPHLFEPPVRKVIGRKKGGRLGSRRGQSTGRISSAIKNNDLSVIPASWIPLILPYSRSTESCVQMKPIFTPWLNELSEARVQRFATGMKHLLASFVSGTNELSDRTREFVGPTVGASSNAFHSTSRVLFASPKTESKDLNTYSEQHQLASSEEYCVPTDNVDSALPPSSPIDLSRLTKPASAFKLNRFSRGRCKRRRPYESRSSFLRTSDCVSSECSSQCTGQTSTVCVTSDTPVDHVSSTSVVSRAAKPSKSRVSRELRGLVTWDAVIAQQRRQLAQEPQNECTSIDSKQPRQGDPTVAIAEGLLAQAALDNSGALVTRTRRLRHLSGTTLGQMPQSTGDSETASVATVTASESAEVLPHLRHGEHSSAMKSTVSTASSSVTSDLPTANQLPTDSVVDDKSAKYSRRPRTVIDEQIDSHLGKPHSKMLQSADCQTANLLNDSSQYFPKYSPISVDPESESQVAVAEVQQPNHETVFTEKTDWPQKPGSLRRNSRCFHKRLYSETQAYTSLSTTSDASTCTSVKESAEVTAFSSPTPGVFEKRRRSRQHVTTSFCVRDSQVCCTSIELSPGPLEAPRTPHSTPPRSTYTDPASIRRSMTSRNAVLPPRKRYKEGTESHCTPVAELDPSFQHVVEFSENPSSPVTNCVVADFSIHSISAESRTIGTVVDDPAIFSSSSSAIRKRTRGRPARRGLSASQSQPTMLTFESTSNAHPQHCPVDRPKREAAVLGFASLVAAKLNNNAQVPGPLSLVDSLDTRGCGPDATNSCTTSSECVTMPIISSPLPRGRGRPPKVKPFAPLSAITPSSAGTDLQPQPAQSTRRQLRRSSSSPCDGSFPSSHISTVGGLIPVHSSSVAPSTFAASVAHPSVFVEPVSTLQGIRKVGRPRLRQATEKPKEDSAREPVDRSLLSASMTTATAFRILPTHNSLFRGHFLTDSIPLGLVSKFQLRGPLGDVFSRFLNEPDPSDPTSRLVSPILYLPPPERYPEFYRFILSAYSGAFIRTRFVDAFFKRLFNSYEQPQIIANEPIFSVEFPSLCLASIANWFTLQLDSGKLRDQLIQDLGLTESELTLISLNPLDAENSIPLLDAAIENVLSVWESFAGRRSWLGRRISSIRSFYFTLRNECVRSIADEFDQVVPPLKATAVLNMPTSRPSSGGGKKKADRRALERGAEVIRCLCGFRVEGGHVMVQCDRCASWQHLPCLWWALSQAIKQTTHATENSQLYQAALFAARLVGSGCSTDSIESHKCMSSENEELPYFCPICLDLTNLTLDYPRSLSVAMAMNDVSAVFDPKETDHQSEREFWSLASVNNRHQIRTDDYGYIGRSWLELALKASSNRVDFRSPEEVNPIFHPLPVDSHDRIIIRIYRLWKDPSGKPWMEGGLFLRPYDVPCFADISETPEQDCLWHLQEVVYDETSRLILPLSAWIGRCTVLCPSAYRIGRVADLTSSKEANQFLFGLGADGTPVQQCTNKPRMNENQHYVCEKLFDRTKDCRIEDISPGYLKVNMRSYCFLRKPDAIPGRTVLTRQYTAAQLLEYDRTLLTYSESTTSCSVVKPRGEKLARVVDRLERKRQLDSRAADQPVIGLTTTCTVVNTVGTSPTNRVTASYRGRTRGSRGRARICKPIAQSPVAQCAEVFSALPSNKAPSSNCCHGIDYSNVSCLQMGSCPIKMNSREPVVELIDLTTSEEPLTEIENDQPVGLAVVDDSNVEESSEQILTVSINQLQLGLEPSRMNNSEYVPYLPALELSQPVSDSGCDVRIVTSVEGAVGMQTATVKTEVVALNLISSPSTPSDVLTGHNDGQLQINSRTVSERALVRPSMTSTFVMSPLRKRKQQPRTRNSSTSVAHLTDSEKPYFFSDVEVSDNRENTTLLPADLLPLSIHTCCSVDNCSADPKICSISDSLSQPDTPDKGANAIRTILPMLESKSMHSPLEEHCVSLESVEESKYSQDAVTLNAVVGTTNTTEQPSVTKSYKITEHISEVIQHGKPGIVSSIKYAAISYIPKEFANAASYSPDVAVTDDASVECSLKAHEPSNLQSSLEQPSKKAEFLSECNTTPLLDEPSSPSDSLLSSAKLTSVGVSSLTYLLPLGSEMNREISGTNVCTLSERKSLPLDTYCPHRDRRNLPSPRRTRMRPHRRHSPATRHLRDSVYFEECRDRQRSRYDHHKRHWSIDQTTGSSFRYRFNDQKHENHDRRRRDHWEQSTSPSDLSRRYRHKHRSSPTAPSRSGRRSNDKHQPGITNPNS